MAITFEWDLAKDAEATISRNNGDHLVRVGLARGLTNATTTPPKMLIDAIAATVGAPGGIPQNYPDSRVKAQLSYVTARALTSQMATVYTGYDTPSFSGPSVDRLAIEDVTNLVNEPTQLLFGTGTPLLVTLDPNTAGASIPKYDASLSVTSAKVKLVTSNAPRNWRALVLYGLFSTRPSAAILNLANRVNAAPWQDRDIGYWKCEGPRVRWSSSHGLYAVSLPIISRGVDPGDDWSTYEPAQINGEYIKPSPGLMSNLVSQPYAYGIRNNCGGMLKVGQFFTASFAGALDPLIDGTPLSQGSSFFHLFGA